jgi:predicted enzyme related to lactoylglutathione lyase
MSLLSEGNPLFWFELPAADIGRAKRFYETIFDTTLQDFDAGDLRFAFFPMKEGAPNGAGALVHYPAMYKPSQDGALVYFAVTDIDAVLNRVEPAGGTVFQRKKHIEEFGYVGFFGDSEGNRVGLHART